MKKIYCILIATFIVIFFSITTSSAIEIPVLHLKTSTINFTDNILSNDINFYITNSGTSTGTINYSITASATNLIDSHNSSNKIPVTFTIHTNSMNLATKVTDESLSNKITASISKPTKAGEYSGTATVTFNNLGIKNTISYGEDIGNKAYDYNTAIGTLPTPTKSGYKFLGWYLDSDYKTQLTTSYIITGNITVYAKWTQIYAVTYNLNGGTVSTANKTSYTVLDSNFKLNNPTRSGYVFAGWTGTDLSERTLNVTAKTASAKNLSYTANWKQQITSGWYGSVSQNGCTLNDFLISYENSNRVTVFLNITGNPSAVKAPTWKTGDNTQAGIDWNTFTKSSWSRSGRTFNWARNMSWSAKQAYTTHVYITCNGTQSYYKGASGYIPDSVRLTYNGNGGTTTSAATIYNYNYDVSLPTNTTTRANYTFLGWSTTTDGNILTKMRMGESATTLYAQWAKTSN